MPILHVVLALLIVMVWGFNFVVIKVGLVDIPPLLLCCSRFLLTSLPAVFFIKRPKAPFKMVIWYGLIMFALQFSLLFMGMAAGLSAGLSSLLLQVHVFFTILLGSLFFGENLHKWQIVGALVSFCGIALVAMNLSGSVTLMGFVLVIAAAASWGFGNVISKKIGKVNMVSLVIWGSLVAWPPLLAISFWLEGPERILKTFENISWLSGGAVLYITYLSTLFAYSVWSWLIHHHPLGTIAPFSLLVPVIAIMSSVLVLGEPLQSWKILAAILVISGLCINLFGRKIIAIFRK